MGASIECFDANFRKLCAAMDPKMRLKALKGAFRREANRVRKTAIKNLRESIRSDRDLERGVRAMLYKRKSAGFRVTVGTKRIKKSGKEYGYHLNRKGLKKPVLMWADAGTKMRKTAKPTKYLVGGRWRTGRMRGYMKQYGFMQKTADEVRDSITDRLRKEVINSVKKVAKQYGCT